MLNKAFIFNALIISCLFGYAVNYIVLDRFLWPRVKKEGPPTDRWVVAALGIVERLLYPLALFFNYPQFILFWLSLKTAIKWPKWKNDEERSYNLFLFGNATNVLSSAIAVLIVK